jgi:ABC-2 type transport system permease protein
MNTYIAYIKKEFMELIRTSRFIAIAAGLLFFALLDPIMLKVTPDILKSQLGNVSLASLGVELSQRASIIKFASNINSISVIVIVLAIMNLIASEIKDKTIILPHIAGMSPFGFIFAKLSVTSFVIVLFNLLSFGTALYYSNLLFTGSASLSNNDVFISALLYCLFFCYVVALSLFYGTVSKSGLLTVIFTLATVFATSALSALLPNAAKYLPSAITDYANSFKYDNKISITIAENVVLIIALSIVSSCILKRAETQK